MIQHVTSDHAVQIPVGAGGTTILVLAGDTVYYADVISVTASANQGSLTSGGSATITDQPLWVRSASQSDIQVSVLAAPGSSTGGIVSGDVAVAVGVSTVNTVEGGLTPVAYSGSPTDGLVPVWSASGNAWLLEPPVLSAASGPGGTPGANSTAALTISTPVGASGFGQYWLTMNAATVTVTMPSATVGAEFILRASQDASGGRALAFAAAPPVVFPGVAQNLNSGAHAENWFVCECSPDPNNSNIPTWFVFPATSGASNLSDIADAGTARLNLAVPVLGAAKAAATGNVTSLSGAQTIDGYSAVALDRVLLPLQTTASQRGPWIVSAGTWVRPTDYASGAVLATGRMIQVSGGSTNSGIWTVPGPITVDTTSTTWTAAGATYGATIPAGDSSTLATAGAAATASRSDHAHPRTQWTPEDYGLITAAYDLQFGSAGTALTTAGTVYVIRLHMPVAKSVTNICLAVATAGGTLTGSQCIAGLYQGGTLLGSIADQSAVWNGAGYYVKPIVGGAVAVAAGDVYVAAFFNGTTGPAFPRSASAASYTIILTGNNARVGSADTGRTTTLPGTLGTITAIGTSWWAGLS